MGNCLSSAEPPAPRRGSSSSSNSSSKRVSSAATLHDSKSSSHSRSSSRNFDDFLVLTADPSSPPPPPITELFTLGRVLGRGSFGVTRLARDRATGAAVAVKTIARRRIVAGGGGGGGSAPSSSAVERIRCEVEAMRRVSGHPNVVSFKSAHEDAHGVHLAMELCSGGELFDQVSKRGAYTEACAASLVRELVGLVAHLHSKGVVHRDLKPENLLLESSDPGAALKAIDFGLAALVEPEGGGKGEGAKKGGVEKVEEEAPKGGSASLSSASNSKSSSLSPSSTLSFPPSASSSFLSKEPLTELCGSPLYIAPEVLRRSYGKGADMWSVGVIAFVLLTGTAPFEGQTEKQLFEEILNKELDVRRQQSEPWPQLSPGAKDFVARLLERDPRRRLTAEQALKHPWLSEDTAAAEAMKKCTKQLDVLRTMCNFAAAGTVRKRAAAEVAQRAPPEVIEALLPAFRAVDAGDARDGTVSLGALPTLLGCVDAGMTALKHGKDAGAAVRKAGEAAAREAVAVAAAGSACAVKKEFEEEKVGAAKTKTKTKTKTASSSPPPPPSSSPSSSPSCPSYSYSSATSKAILAVFREVMGHDGTQCGCRVDYAALLEAAASEARALREETLASSLGRLDFRKTGELPRAQLEAATRRHCRAIPQHVIDRALAAAREAGAEASCSAKKMAAKKKRERGGEIGGVKSSSSVAVVAKLNSKPSENDKEGEEEMVDYELFCAALARVCPSCPKAAKAA